MKKINYVFVKILCVAVVFILLISFVYGHSVIASEINEFNEQNDISIQNKTVLDENNDGLCVVGPMFLIDDAPDKMPPQGYVYSRNIDGTWEISKLNENNDSAFIISNLPEECDVKNVTLFIGNLETQNVMLLNINSEESYVNNIDLNDGYYVLFSNEMAFCDSNGVGYSINGGENLYFHVGSEFDSEKYPVEFMKVSDGYELFKLSLAKAPDNFQKINNGVVLSIDSSSVNFPKDVKENVLGIVDGIVQENSPENTIESTNESIESIEQKEIESEEEDETSNDSIFSSPLVIVFLAVMTVVFGLLIAGWIKTKNGF